MYELMVSYDCGMFYGFDSRAETLAELQPRLDELDAQMLRWYVAKDGEMDTSAICAIYAGIFATMEALNSLVAQPNDRTSPGEGER